jgi:hypothetical protein
MSDTFDKAKDAAEGVMRRTEETVQEVTKRAGRAATKARDRASEMMDDVDPHAARVGLERWTRARPLVALLVAGAIGAIIGRALFPRRS